MAGSHLQRTGYRHGVLAIAALGALVSAMWANSAFAQPISKTQYDNTIIMRHAFAEASQYGKVILGLNAASFALITVMTLILDWHFDVRFPAYVEYTWVGLLWCAELIATILGGISEPTKVCWLEKTVADPNDKSNRAQILLGKSMCSTWRGMLGTSIIALVVLTIHFVWHLTFRLWHRATLASLPTFPVNIWTTPLPRHYPITPREKQKTEDPAFSALDERGAGAKPEDSVALDPYSLIFTPVAARKAERSAKDAAEEHAAATSVPVLTMSPRVGDPEKASTPELPQGLENVIEKRGSRLP